MCVRPAVGFLVSAGHFLGAYCVPTLPGNGGIATPLLVGQCRRPTCSPLDVPEQVGKRPSGFHAPGAALQPSCEALPSAPCGLTTMTAK